MRVCTTLHIIYHGRCYNKSLNWNFQTQKLKIVENTCMTEAIDNTRKMRVSLLVKVDVTARSIIPCNSIHKTNFKNNFECKSFYINASQFIFTSSHEKNRFYFHFVNILIRVYSNWTYANGTAQHLEKGNFHCFLIECDWMWLSIYVFKSEVIDILSPECFTH